MSSCFIKAYGYAVHYYIHPLSRLAYFSIVNIDLNAADLSVFMHYCDYNNALDISLM